MADEKLNSCNAPVRPGTEAELRTLAGRLEADPVVLAKLEGFPGVVMLLDAHRKIVACNQALVQVARAPDCSAVVGRRVAVI